MSGRLPYVKRHKYPHMIGEDREIWNRFIEKFPDRFDTVDYDFRVGKGMQTNPNWPEYMKVDAIALTQKRIDVLAWNDEQPTIIEVKKRVGLSTLGQILGYFQLFIDVYKNITKPKVLVICETIGRDDFRVLEVNKVPVEIV